MSSNEGPCGNRRVCEANCAPWSLHNRGMTQTYVLYSSSGLLSFRVLLPRKLSVRCRRTHLAPSSSLSPILSTSQSAHSLRHSHTATAPQCSQVARHLEARSLVVSGGNRARVTICTFSLVGSLSRSYDCVC